MIRSKYEDLQDFIQCYNPENRRERTETDRFHAFSYDELVKRDKCSLDIFWLKDESLEDSENLPDPDVLAAEIVESLETALSNSRQYMKSWEKSQQSAPLDLLSCGFGCRERSAA